MFKLNNKGQSLAMFVVIIPIFALLLTLIYDVSSAIYEKNRLSNTSQMVIDYGLDNIDNVNENDLINLTIKNMDDLELISVDIKNNYIEVILEKKVTGIIGNMFGFDLKKVKAHYTGSIIDNVKKIERVK